MSRKLNELDRRLLACLQANNLRTGEDYAERVGRSSSAVARRLNIWRDGSDRRRHSVLSEEAAGRPLSAIVHVQLERHAPQEADRLRRRLVSSLHVQLCLDVAGSFDIILLAVAADMRAYNEFADSVLEENPAVRRFETTFVKRRVKATLTFPLEV
jgi:Lrp/AsnC family leucine-responsive transcriptional regulator